MGTFDYFLVLLSTSVYFKIHLTSEQSLWLDIQLIQISLQLYLALLAVLAIVVLLLLSNSIV